MTLKETGPDRKEILYPDGDLIPRSRLAKAFDCSPFSVERVLRRANVAMLEDSGEGDTVQLVIPVDKFPDVITSIQNAQHGKRKLISDNVDATKDFKIVAANGTIFEYTHPTE